MFHHVGYQKHAHLSIHHQKATPLNNPKKSIRPYLIVHRSQIIVILLNAVGRNHCEQQGFLGGRYLSKAFLFMVQQLSIIFINNKFVVGIFYFTKVYATISLCNHQHDL